MVPILTASFRRLVANEWLELIWGTQYSSCYWVDRKNSRVFKCARPWREAATRRRNLPRARPPEVYFVDAVVNLAGYAPRERRKTFSGNPATSVRMAKRLPARRSPEGVPADAVVT